MNDREFELEADQYMREKAWDSRKSYYGYSTCEPDGSWKFSGFQTTSDSDHPTFMFEVEVVYYGKEPDNKDCPWQRESHGLIYTDDVIAVTLYECCYSLWHLVDGHSMHNPYGRTNIYEWKLTPESLEKIKTRGLTRRDP